MARGIPNNPVTCKKCGGGGACPADQLCHKCQAVLRLVRGVPRKFTEPEDALIREAWTRQRSKSQLTRNIDRLVTKLNLDRETIRRRALALGVTAQRPRAWKQSEVDFLREHAGVRSNWWISRKLKRSMHAVRVRSFLMGLSLKVIDGYSRAEIARLFGTAHSKVRGWIDRGWLPVQRSTDTIAEASLANFIHDHPDQYDLCRVDEVWFKSIAFPAIRKRLVTVQDDAEEACA